MTREQAIHSLIAHGFKVEQVGEIIKAVTPQEPQTFKWCTDCKEYDQEKHCCHRWSKVIRDTVEEMKQEQEPFINKPCVSSGVCEHDKNEVLDKLRAGIEKLRPNLRPEQMTDYDYAMVYVVNDIVAILDKYKAEVEQQESEDKA